MKIRLFTCTFSDCIQHSLSLESSTLPMLSSPLRSCLPFSDHQFHIGSAGFFPLCFSSCPVRFRQCPISCPSSRLILHRVGLHDDKPLQSSLFTRTISAVVINLATVPADTVVLAFAFVLAFAHFETAGQWHTVPAVQCCRHSYLRSHLSTCSLSSSARNSLCSMSSSSPLTLAHCDPRT